MAPQTASCRFVSKDLYDQIKAFGPAAAKERPGRERRNGRRCVCGPSPRCRRSWDDIKVGDRVLAQDTDPADGWWQVTVTEANGDLFKLRWPGSGRGRPFQKHRSMLGLICPGREQRRQPNPIPSRRQASPAVYPSPLVSDRLNQIVLAKEDGPAEQWWEAKTVKLDKDHVHPAMARLSPAAAHRAVAIELSA